MRSSLLALLAALVAGAAVADAADAKVYLSRTEAVAAAFPDADRVEERNLVLDDAQARSIEGLARSPLGTRIVTVYTGMRAGEVLGHALIDIHTVRTLPEAFMVVMSPDGKVRSLRMLAFYEPEEYRPPDRWLRQFERQGLDPDLRLQGRIHGIAGSTLSSRAVTGAVRRALALWEVVLAPAAPAVADTPSRAPSPGR